VRFEAVTFLGRDDGAEIGTYTGVLQFEPLGSLKAIGDHVDDILVFAMLQQFFGPGINADCVGSISR